MNTMRNGNMHQNLKAAKTFKNAFGALLLMGLLASTQALSQMADMPMGVGELPANSANIVSLCAACTGLSGNDQEQCQRLMAQHNEPSNGPHARGPAGMEHGFNPGMPPQMMQQSAAQLPVN